MQLPIADVERDDARSAALEQAVGESTGRRPDVQAVPAGRVDVELVERVRQLLAPARDEPRRPRDVELHLLGDLLTRLVVAPHEPRDDQSLGLCPALREPALDEQHVEPLAHEVRVVGCHHASRCGTPATS